MHTVKAAHALPGRLVEPLIHVVMHVHVDVLGDPSAGVAEQAGDISILSPGCARAQVAKTWRRLWKVQTQRPRAGRPPPSGCASSRRRRWASRPAPRSRAREPPGRGRLVIVDESQDHVAQRRLVAPGLGAPGGNASACEGERQ